MPRDSNRDSNRGRGHQRTAADSRARDLVLPHASPLLSAAAYDYGSEGRAVTALFEIGPADVADTNDDWYTPPWIFDAAALTFDMDVCAPVDPARRTCPARRYLTPVEDGLAIDWHGMVWMNPPFSGSRPWVERFAEHRSGMALLPTIRRQWFGTLIRCADAIALLEVDFIRPGGGRGDLPQVSVLAACGRAAVDALGRVAAADRYLQGSYHVRPA